jgi:hypothetical protein
MTLPTLGALVTLAERHWKRHTPKRYRALKQAGTLEQELLTAAKLTLVAMEDDMLTMGLRVHEAWERQRERYLIVPEGRPRRDQGMSESEAFRILMKVNGGNARD